MLSRRLLSLASSSASRVSALRSFHAARPLCAESDPFPLPFDPALLAQQQRPRHDQAEEQMAQWEAIQPIKRVGEDDNKMRARLIYQTRKRGMLENDLLLSTFAKNELPSMTREQMEEFDKVSGEHRGGSLVLVVLVGVVPSGITAGPWETRSWQPVTLADITAPRRKRLGRLLLGHGEEGGSRALGQDRAPCQVS